jgi:hypothetical protein
VVPTEEQSKHPHTFSRSVKNELFSLKRKYRRIQAIAKDDEFHGRWLSWLGFKREGVLRKYNFEGEDMVIWGMV